jgi:ADP-heptose:LPS heptosyltransferase
MGVGDALMASGEIKELKKKKPGAKFIIGDGNKSYWNEVFDNNPFIIRNPEEHKYNEIIWINNYEGNRPYRNYGDGFPKNKYNWKKYKALKGEFYFTKNEITIAEEVITAIRNNIGQKKLIFIEPHVKKRLGYENKDWGFHNWERVVEELKSLYAFLQITYAERQPIKGSINIDGIKF